CRAKQPSRERLTDDRHERPIGPIRARECAAPYDGRAQRREVRRVGGAHVGVHRARIVLVLSLAEYIAVPSAAVNRGDHRPADGLHAWNGGYGLFDPLESGFALRRGRISRGWEEDVGNQKIVRRKTRLHRGEKYCAPDEQAPPISSTCVRHSS